MHKYTGTEDIYTNAVPVQLHKVHAQVLITRLGKRMAATVPRTSERLVVIVACTVAAICLCNYPMYAPLALMK